MYMDMDMAKIYEVARFVLGVPFPSPHPRIPLPSPLPAVRHVAVISDGSVIGAGAAAVVVVFAVFAFDVVVLAGAVHSGLAAGLGK